VETLVPAVKTRFSSRYSLSTTSFTAVQTMQAVHQLPPHLLAHRYPRHSLNGITSNPGPSAMPTPPVTARKRKRAHQYTVSYSEVQELGSDGRLREVIVIEDTPPPPTMSPATTHTGAFSASYQPPMYSAPIRTRARAAAEAQALSSSSSSAIVAPVPKKRKREHPEEVRAPPAKKLVSSNHQTHQVVQTKSWDSRSAAATDDVRMRDGHGVETC
jgi:dual-specificity kinase